MVAFGEELQMSQNPAHGLYYVDYESLKLVLQDSTSNEQLGILIQRHHDA